MPRRLKYPAGYEMIWTLWEGHTLKLFQKKTVKAHERGNRRTGDTA